jgi:aryl-phospho-beta-D-glucosidase BglC (GH1 family)
VDASSGQPVGIKALNWFGLNTDQMAPDGLWAGGSDTATDFLEIVYQIKLLGFNAVRLPFRRARGGGVGGRGGGARPKGEG